jgi:hypothetical protein
MPTPPGSKYGWQAEAIALRKKGWLWKDIGKKFHVTHNVVSATCARYEQQLAIAAEREKEFIIEPPPDAELPIEELVEIRKKGFERKQRHEQRRRLIPVRVRDNLPIGIQHFGDPHVDDDGTDLGLVEKHSMLVRKTEGIFGANVGDTTNNWIGRLASLWAEQSTTHTQAWRLAEWFIQMVGPKWLYMVGGNHDAWSGAGDPLKWIAREQNALYQDSEVRVELRFPNGRTVRVNCRHDFDGHSMWNPAHGPMRASQLGVRDHINLCGHRHISGYGVIKDPDSGITCHGIRVASYKLFDRYARTKGFRDQTLSPCAFTVIDTSLPDAHPDLVKVFWDPFEGADFLRSKRRKKTA